jgi:hypothetical protein
MELYSGVIQRVSVPRYCESLFILTTYNATASTVTVGNVPQQLGLGL